LTELRRRRDRTELITIVMRNAWSHRDDGASWFEIAVALGVTENTFRRWHRADNSPFHAYGRESLTD
jgi:hypothetical protein